MRRLSEFNLMEPRGFAQYYKFKFLAWFIMTATFYLLINYSHFAFVTNLNFSVIDIPYTDIWSKELQDLNSPKIFILAYFLIGLVLILYLDVREILIYKNKIEFRDGLIFKIIFISGYFYVIYSWLFAGGLDYFHSRGRGIIHGGEIVQPFVYAIGIPGQSMLIFWMLTLSATSTSDAANDGAHNG